MKYLFYLILLAEAISILVTVIKYNLYLSKKNERTNVGLNVNNSTYHLNIIIPVLREQTIIKSTLEYFESIVDKENTTIYVVATAREEFEKKLALLNIPSLANDMIKNVDINQIISKYNKLLPISKLKELYSMREEYRFKEAEFEHLINQTVNKYPTTYEYLNSIDVVNSNENIKVIRYEETNGIMAHQLNFAIDTILENINESQNTFIDKNYCVIYNADSMPNENTFNEIEAKIIENNFPEVMQQYSLTLSNIDRISDLMKGFGIYQSAFEIKNGLLNSISSNLYSHVVGHGLVIRLDTILDLNKFNTDFWCEDIYLTGAIANKGINIIPLDTLENAETPENLSLQIKQTSNWFRTSSSHFKMAKDIKEKQGTLSKGGILWLLSEIKATFSWLLFPFFILFSLIYPIIVMVPMFIVCSIFAYLTFVYINYYYIVRKFYNENLGLKLYLYTALCLMISNLGPLYSFITVEKHKTPR